MKILIYILMALALIVIIYNLTLLDYSNLFGNENSLAFIGILSATCVLVLLGILLTSKAIAKKEESNEF